ncbi:MAG: PDZ domain-containing protein [Calditrichaeota bacterium]|nr:PDZ domain-containing protein [Calditrichota bacterium]
MKLLISFVTLLVTAATLFAAPAEGYYRWPTAYGSQVAFVADNDLWIAPLNGGSARRLTSAAGEERFAMFSPDGKWIAFSANYDGNIDVYVVSPEGGEPHRLTYHPGADWVAAWTNDGRVAYRNYSDNGPSAYQIFLVDTDGNWPEKLELPEAAHITFEPNGDRIAYTRFSLGHRTWKRYKGGWAEQIIVGSRKAMDYKQITTWEGNNATPMWYGDKIFYVRNNDDRDNLYCMNPDGSDIKQLTQHKDYDVRWPSLADGKISYSVGADIYVYDIAAGQSRKVDVSMPSEMLLARDKFISPDDYTNDYGLSPDGKRIVLGARGALFTASTERRGVIFQSPSNDGERLKSPFYSKDGKEIYAWSDRMGDQTLWAYPADGKGEPRKVAPGPSTYNFGIAMSPDGEWGVCGNRDRTLTLINLKSGATSVLDSSEWEIYGYEWSPDSRYIAYGVTLPNKFGGVKIYDMKEKKSHLVTDPMFDSDSPAWDPEGKWLYFSSRRNHNAFPGENDYSFITLNTSQLFALALAKDTKSWYLPEDNTIAGDKKDDEKKDEKNDKKGDKDDKDEKEEKKVDVKIDWDGIVERIVLLPTDPGRYGGLGATEGKLYYIAWDSRGWKDGDFHDEDDPTVALHCFDIKKKKDNVVVDGARGYTFSLDGKKMVVRKKGDFIVMDAGDTKEPEPDKDDKDKGLHLGEWTCDVNPRAEWKQIYWEAWRLERDFFYDANMHGVDWKKQGERYAALLDRITTRDELNDVLGQLFGELNAGHAYIGGGDRERPKSMGVGLLGIDVTREKSGFYKIDKVLAPDPWDKDRTSPLSQVGLNVKAGDYLVAIDRKPVNSVKNYLELLSNKSGKLVMVSVNDKPSLDGAREFVVKTMSNEGELRYWDWVKGRMEYVKEHGGDDIAYLHLSDMSPPGMEQFMREYYPQVYGKKAFIFDVRNNGGGNIARWILTQLDRKIWTWGMARNGSRDHDPYTAFQGHMIALCDEQTGSDGETFSEGWKRLELGPLVGKRTWGGWVGIRGGKPFIDGGGSTQPEFTGWGADGKWLIEGPGVTPDVEVNQNVKNLISGKDDQLDWAIKWCRDEIKKDPRNDVPMPKFPIKAATGPTK